MRRPIVAVNATNMTPQEKALIPLAKKEGAVISLISLFQDRTAKALEKAFRERYGLGDDFSYTNIRKGTGPSLSMARQEIKANRVTFDVIMTAGAGSPRTAGTAVHPQPTARIAVNWTPGPA